jgi:hypothetical protein
MKDLCLGANLPVQFSYWGTSPKHIYWEVYSDTVESRATEQGEPDAGGINKPLF